MIKQPLFIIGIPRSGTTFLHRTLSQDTHSFTTFKLWEFLFAPSITQKFIIKTLLSINLPIPNFLLTLIKKQSQTLIKKIDSMHKLRLNEPEEDFLSLTPYMASFILITPFPQIKEIWNLGYFDKALTEKTKKTIMTLYKQQLQRHLYVFGKEKRILSKNPSFTPKICALKKTFPDCKIIACIRDPKKTIPSQLSTMIESGKLFANNNAKEFYQKEFINLLKFYYEHIIENLLTPSSNHCILPMIPLQKNTYDTILKLYKQLNETVSTQYNNQLKTIHLNSKSYKSTHSYSLKQFGINEQRVQNEFDFTYKKLKFNDF